MKLAYHSDGQGHPLVILHGLLGSQENWRTMSQTLSRCYQVLTLDLRNHGHSPHGDVMNLSVMADDVYEFVQAQQLPAIHLLGHSLGGKVAMTFALRHPANVDRLIVEDIAPKAYAPEYDPVFQALLSLDLNAIQWRKDADRALQERIPDQTFREFLLMNLDRDPEGAWHWKPDLRSIYNHYAEVNKAVEASGTFDKPVLFIKGGLSDYVQPQDWESIQKIFPSARLATVPNVGHWVHHQARGKFARLVLAFREEKQKP